MAQDIERTERIVQYYHRPPCLSPNLPTPGSCATPPRTRRAFPNSLLVQGNIPLSPHTFPPCFSPHTLKHSSSDFCIDLLRRGHSLLLQGQSQIGLIRSLDRSLRKAFPRYAGRTLAASGSNLPIYSSYVRICCPSSKVPAAPRLNSKHSLLLSTCQLLHAFCPARVSYTDSSLISAIPDSPHRSLDSLLVSSLHCAFSIRPSSGPLSFVYSLAPHV